MSHTPPKTELRQKPGRLLVEVFAMMQLKWAERRENGATAVEYALMVGLISVAIILAVALMGNGLNTSYRVYANTIPS
jgi:pilus assembly protein Flp/PilA